MSTPAASLHPHPSVETALGATGQLLTRRRRRVLVTGAMTALLSAPLAFSAVPAQAVSPGGLVDWGWVACAQDPPSMAAGVVQVAGRGTNGKMAVKYDGSVTAWHFAAGSLYIDSLPAAMTTDVVKVDVSQGGEVALKSNGSVVDGTGVTRVAAGSGITDLELTRHLGIGLKNGGVVAWHNMWDGGAGSDPYGILSVPASVSSPGSGVTAVGAGYSTAYAVKNGGVIAWGSNSFGQTTVPASASSGVVSVAGGRYATIALKSDGSVIGWGTNYGLLNIPAGASSGVIEISADDDTAMALKSDGSVLVWGVSHCGNNAPTTYPWPGAGSGVTKLSGGQLGTGVAIAAATGPASLGGTLASAPTVSKRPGTAIQDVFYLNGSNEVIHNTLTSGVLGTSENLGGTAKAGSTIASVSRTGSEIDIFARFSDDSLWHKYYNGSSWTGWTQRSSAGHATSSPTVSSWSWNRLDLFVRGSANDLQHSVYDASACSGWCSFGWESLGGTLTTAPAAVSWGYNRIDIFAGGAGNALQQKAYNAGWIGWYNLGGSITSDPSVSSKGTDQLDIYARNASNGLSSLHYSWGSGWSSWQDRGSLSSANGSAPASNSFVTGNKAVYFRGTDNALWQRLY